MPPAKQSTALARPSFGLRIETVSDLVQISQLMYSGGCMPPGVDRPEKAAVIIMAGLEVGLAPAQAIGSIMLVSGKPSIYGDGAMALVLASGLLAFIDEKIVGEGDDQKAICVIERKGLPRRTYEYSVADAKAAELWGKKDNWKKHPKRMLTMRPRGFAFRDNFADVLRGLSIWEEVVDIETPRVVQVEPATPALPAAATVSAPVIPEPATPAVVVTSAVVATPAPATATTPPLSTTPAIAAPTSEKVTEQQLGEILVIRNSMLAGWGAVPEIEKTTRWKECVREYGAISAKDFTFEQAARFIRELGPKHDPFGHPSSANSAA